MEAPEPIKYEKPTPNIDNENINFIEELLIKKEIDVYKIQFGIKGNKDELEIKVIPENLKHMNYYYQNYTINELQKLSKIFAIYETVKDIISFLKNSKYEIDEKNEDLILKFNVYMPDGKSKIIELTLKKYLMDINQMIKYLFEENKSIKEHMEKEISNLKNKHESEIKMLKDELSNMEENNVNKELNYNKEISNMKEKNKKLRDEINQFKRIVNLNLMEKVNSNSQIIQSINSIDFILSYTKENDKSFKFNDIKLLYRGSRDGDRTKTCHELCDNKQNILIIMQSNTEYIFGGYSKIGFKTINDRKKIEYKIDNDNFLFSLNLKKIYPVIKDKDIICHISDEYGLCFRNSLVFRDNFMSKNDNNISSSIKSFFNGLKDDYEMNGGLQSFQCKELEVFQLI